MKSKFYLGLLFFSVMCASKSHAQACFSPFPGFTICGGSYDSSYSLIKPTPINSCAFSNKNNQSNVGGGVTLQNLSTSPNYFNSPVKILARVQTATYHFDWRSGSGGYSQSGSVTEYYTPSGKLNVYANGQLLKTIDFVKNKDNAVFDLNIAPFGSKEVENLDLRVAFIPSNVDVCSDLPLASSTATLLVPMRVDPKVIGAIVNVVSDTDY